MTTLSRSQIRSAIAAAFPDADEATLNRATGAAARALVGTSRASEPFGPAEEHGYNSHPIASWRMERRAKDAHDIGTLRYLARCADSVGATSVAEHVRTIADIYAQGAEIDAYCDLSSAGAITNTRPVYSDTRPYGPAIREAYHAPTDMFVEVLREASDDDHTVTFRHPYFVHTDACAASFLD